MIDILVQWVSIFPPEMATALLAMIPVTELRAAIPIAISFYDLPLWSIVFWAVIGDVIPVFFIMATLGPVSSWLMKHSKFFNKLFNKIFDRTRNKFTKKYEKYGLVSLIIFVGIPLPGTGAWTGTLAAWLFGIPFRKAFPYIFVGILLAATLVTIISLGIFSSLEFIFG